MVDRNEQAKQEMMQKMIQQRMMGSRGMDHSMMDEMPPQKELTPEEKVEMEKKQKEAEVKRRKDQIVSLKRQLEQKDAALTVKECYLARVAANKDVMINVNLADAKTEWHKKATQAELDELDAILNEAKLDFGYEKEARENMEKQLNELQIQEKIDEA